MNKVTLNGFIHYPGCDPTLVSSNSASESEGLTGTGGGSYNKLSSNIACIENSHLDIHSYLYAHLVQ